jgi:hypothetical protein
MQEGWQDGVQGHLCGLRVHLRLRLHFPPGPQEQDGGALWRLFPCFLHPVLCSANCNAQGHHDVGLLVTVSLTTCRGLPIPPGQERTFCGISWVMRIPPCWNPCNSVRPNACAAAIRCAWTSTSACRRTRRRWTRSAPATAAPARTCLAATSAPLRLCNTPACCLLRLVSQPLDNWTRVA